MTEPPRRWPRGRRLVLLLAGGTVCTLAVAATVALAVVGRDGGRVDSPSPSSDPVVAWVDEPWDGTPPTPRPTPTPKPITTPACRSGAIRAEVGETNGVSSHTGTVVHLVNAGATACSLDGFPSLAGVTSSGRRVPLDAGHVTYIPGPGDGGDLAPGERGEVLVATTSACESFGSVTYPRVELTLASGAAFTLDLPVDASCSVAVSMAGPPPRRYEPEPTPEPGSVAALRATLERLPERVRAGGPLDYVVRLTNPTDLDVDLTDCPGYVQNLGGLKRAHTLNCREAPVVPAGRSVRFAMRLDVPASQPSGDTKFGWTLMVAGGPGAGGAVWVVGPGG